MFTTVLKTMRVGDSFETELKNLFTIGDVCRKFDMAYLSRANYETGIVTVWRLPDDSLHSGLKSHLDLKTDT